MSRAHMMRWSLRMVVWVGPTGDWSKRHLARSTFRTLCGLRVVRAFGLSIDPYDHAFGESEDDCDQCRVQRLKEIMSRQR